MFNELIKVLVALDGRTFDEGSLALIDWMDSLTKDEFVDLMRQIGTIPESIDHDSTAEKLFSKATDAALSRAFREIGLKSRVLHERGDSADVIAESKYHGYTLVADSKAFRLSRTARNQKDYKVVALSGWRQDADYAVLCAPYFQYPSRESQIYKQALDHNVALFSWEQVLVLLDNHVIETALFDLSPIWNWSYTRSGVTTARNMKACFLRDQVRDFAAYIGLTDEQVVSAMLSQIEVLQERGGTEVAYWNKVIEAIRHYSKEQAINELIAARKIPSKISTIENYVSRLSYE